MDERRIASFIEYVCRPLVEDIRQILEQLKSLNVGLTSKDVRWVCTLLGCWHLVGELIRGGTYIAVAWIVCQTLRSQW